MLGLVLTLLGPLDAARPPVARADQTVVIDFETGPALDTTPVTDEYSATSFVRFIQEDPGFAGQYGVRWAGPGAFGSDVFVDVGADVCLIDGNPGQDCEFPGAGTQGRLSHTASPSRSLAASNPSSGQVTARLVALRTDGSEAASSPAVPGFNATNSGTCAGYRHECGGGHRSLRPARGRTVINGGAALGFDDLTWTYPDNLLPDVSFYSRRRGFSCLSPAAA